MGILISVGASWIGIGSVEQMVRAVVCGGALIATITPLWLAVTRMEKRTSAASAAEQQARAKQRALDRQ